MGQMDNSFGVWSSYIPKCDLDKTVDYVLTGYNAETMVSAEKEVLDFVKNPDQKLRVLDFGCGVCRNAIPISKKFSHWDVTGYDNPNMLQRAKDLCVAKYNHPLSDIKNLTLETSWDKLKTLTFDIVYATIVFQHIAEAALNVYISDLKNMTKKLVVYGRRFNDDRFLNGSYKNTWQILENNGLKPSNLKGYSVEGEPEDHHGYLYEL